MTENTSFNSVVSDGIAAPFGKYAHAAHIPAGRELFVFSGLVGCTREGEVPAEAGAQTEIIFKSLETLLRENGLGVRNLAKLTFYVTTRSALPAIRVVRDRWLDGHLPAMSLVLVAGLGREEWLLEMDGCAVADEKA